LMKVCEFWHISKFGCWEIHVTRLNIFSIFNFEVKFLEKVSGM